MTFRNDEMGQNRPGEADHQEVVPPVEAFSAPRQIAHPDLPEWEKPVVIRRPFWLADPMNQLTIVLVLLAAVAVLVVAYFIMLL